MDVHTGETTYRSDPVRHSGVVPASAGADQGRLFHDAAGAPPCPDTDQLPAVSRRARPGRPSGAPRWLRAMVAVVAVAILAGGVALALVESGVIGGTTSPSGGGQTHATTPPTIAKATKNFLTPDQSSAGPQSANYTIPVRAFAVTVTTGPGISWVTIGVVGQTPIYEGILQANSSQREILLGPAEVSVGAGGTTVKVTSGHHSQTLIPPAAPYSYQITPKL